MSSSTVKAGRWFQTKVADSISEGALETAGVVLDTDLTAALADYELSADVAADAEAAIAAKTEIAALTAGPTVTYTAGSAPAVSGSLTIADSATPTVTELLDYIVELNAKVNAITAALKA